jgi:hypothetical protein
MVVLPMVLTTLFFAFTRRFGGTVGSPGTRFRSGSTFPSPGPGVLSPEPVRLTSLLRSDSLIAARTMGNPRFSSCLSSGPADLDAPGGSSEPPDPPRGEGALGRGVRLELFEAKQSSGARQVHCPSVRRRSPGSDPSGDETSSWCSLFGGVLSGSVRLGGAISHPAARRGAHRSRSKRPRGAARRRRYPGRTSRLPRPKVSTMERAGSARGVHPRARRAAEGSDAIASLVALSVAGASRRSEERGRNPAEAGRAREVRSRRRAERVGSRILKQENDGALDEVHQLRDAYGADLVQLMVEEETAAESPIRWGGRGLVLGGRSPWSKGLHRHHLRDGTSSVTTSAAITRPDPTTKRLRVLVRLDLSRGFAPSWPTVGRRVARFSNPRVFRRR